MAWRDPWHARYYAWALAPDVVMAGQIDFVYSGEGLIVYTPSAGSVYDVKAGMTALIGTTAGADDKGRARVWYDSSLTYPDIVFIVAPLNRHDGEVYPEVGDYITVLDDYRVWLKPPAVTGTIYLYDGGTFPVTQHGSVGTTTDQLPIANAGPAYAQFIDEITGAITVSFDASNSFAVADDAVLGGYTADLFGGAEVVTATSGTAANAVDGNAGTYCEFTSTGLGEYLQVDWGDGNDQPIRKCEIDAIVDNAPTFTHVLIQYSDDNTNYITAYVEEALTANASPATYTFYVHHVGAHRYWRLYPFLRVAPNYTRVYEWRMYAEDRTAGSSPYAWDVDDGTITSGTSSSEAITATFPPGFRWVHLTVTDTNGQAHITHVPVAGFDILTGVQTDYTGATYNESANTAVGFEAEKAFDGDTGTYWFADISAGGPEYPEIVLAGAVDIVGYEVVVNDSVSIPRDWTMNADGSPVDTHADVSYATWSAGGFRLRFVFDTPQTGTTWRMSITDANSPDSVGVQDIILFEDSAGEFVPLDCAVTALTSEPAGQVLELELYQTLAESSYPDGTLVLAWQEEYYSLSKGSLSAAGPTGRTHMLGQFWIDTEPTRIEATEAGLVQQTTLRCIDVGQRLAQLTDFSIMVERDDVPGAYLAYQMKHANMDCFLYLVVQWLSTAAEVADFTWSNTADQFNIGVLASQGSNIYELANQNARAITHLFTCNKHGQLQVVPDGTASPSRFRVNEVTQEALTNADYTSIEWQRQRTPRYHWVRGAGVSFNAADADDAAFSAAPLTVVEPGTAPGQGVNAEDYGGLLASRALGLYGAAPDAYADIRETIARRYAQLQAFVSPFTIALGHSGDTGLDPAEQHLVTLTIDAATAAQRGLTLSAAECVVQRVSIRFNNATLSREVIIEVEQRQAYITGA